MNHPLKTKTFINSPSGFFHYEPLSTSFFSKKFNHTWSGNIFKKTEVLRLYLIFSFYRLDILYTFGSFLNQDRLYQHSSFWPQNGYTNRAFPSDGRVF